MYIKILSFFFLMIVKNFKFFLMMNKHVKKKKKKRKGEFVNVCSNVLIFSRYGCDVLGPCIREQHRYEQLLWCSD